MNKKALGIFVSLLVVAMLVLPMSAAFATKPAPITGTLTMLDPMSYVTFRPLGNSGNQIWTFTDAPLTITGDIEADGVYNGLWVMIKPFTPDMKVVARGVYTLDAEVDDIAGELTIGVIGGKLTIIGGTDGLKSLHGTGSMYPLDETLLVFAVSLDVHFDPQPTD